MRNLSKVLWVFSTCFSFNEPPLWIEAKAFRKFPARLTRAAPCFSDRSHYKNFKTAVAHCHQLEECELWSDKTWPLPEPEIWISMRIWSVFLWWDVKRKKKKEKKGKRKGKKNIFCFCITQMFLASLGSEIAHSQVRPVTLEFGNCDSWQHPLPGNIRLKMPKDLFWHSKNISNKWNSSDFYIMLNHHFLSVCYIMCFLWYQVIARDW